MKKTFYIKKYFLILVAVFLVCTKFVNVVNANEELFKNNLLKMDVYKTALGELKVTFYTTKPYNDHIVVNKKSDTEYVILMPETSNSLTAKPSLASASDVVKNIEVKTQQYIPTQGQKGYTKVVFSTSKPIVITTQLQTINNSGHQLSEKDYSELITQSAKKPVQKASVKPSVKPKTVTKTETAKKVETPKSIKQSAQNAMRKAERGEKTVQKFISKTVQKTQPKKIVKIETPKPIIKKALPPAVQKKKIVEQKTPIVTPQVQKETPKPVVTPLVQKTTPVIIPKVETSNVQPTKLQKIKHLLKKYAFTILGLGLILILLPIFLAKKASKRAAKSPVPQAPQYSQPEEEDNEEVDWKEKLKKHESQHDVENIPYETQDLDGLFGNQESDQDQKTPTEEPYGEESYSEDYSQEEHSVFYDQEPTGWVAPEIEAEIEDYVADLEHESSIDELFGNEDINEGSSAEELLEVVEELSYEEKPFWATEEEQTELEEEKEEQEEFEEPEYQLEEEFEETEELLIEEEIEELEEPKAEPIEEEGEELVLSSFAIDDTKGFYLVDVEDKTALVGYINEEIFVLKRFEEKIQGAIQARLNEKKSNLASFLVKINGFKAIIEVTPDDMKLLIEL